MKTSDIRLPLALELLVHLTIFSMAFGPFRQAEIATCAQITHQETPLQMGYSQTSYQ
jgi:hypothetical protein